MSIKLHGTKEASVKVEPSYLNADISLSSIHTKCVYIDDIPSFEGNTFI